jgi:site-specific DNA recombinase
MNKDQKIVGIYIRVSTEDQAREGHSLEEQQNRIQKICEERKYQVYNVYKDAGISAKDTNRPAYQKMLKDVKNKKINMIYAYKLDRISRSIIDLEMFFNTLKENNCDIECIADNIDTSGASGMMFARMLGIFAQFERELIKERTLIGVESAVSKGHFGGKPPLGYMNEIVNGNKTKNWVINRNEAKIIREIFDLCLKGNTYAQISNIMNAKYPSLISSYKVDRATNEKIPIYRIWRDCTISVILNNKIYIGIYEYRKTVKDKKMIEILGKIPPIISEDIFDECQESIKRNSRNYYRNKSYLFMQKLICPKCGRVLACNGTRKPNNKEYLYYKCKDCDVYIREEWVEKALIDGLIDLLELYLVLGGNYYPVSNELADDFNNCGVDNKIRFSIDNRLINDKKKGIVRYGSVYPIWNDTPYETKCNFIQEYIDTLEITIHSIKGQKEPKIELSKLRLRPNKINMLFELKEKCMLDEVEDYGNYKCSISTFKNENEALKYIDILKKKFNIKTTEKISTEEDYYPYNDDLFKVINILPKKAIEKPKSIYLELSS